MGKNIAVIGMVAIIAATVGAAVKIIKDKKNKKYTNVDYDPDEFTGQDE